MELWKALIFCFLILYINVYTVGSVKPSKTLGRPLSSIVELSNELDDENTPLIRDGPRSKSLLKQGKNVPTTRESSEEESSESKSLASGESQIRRSPVEQRRSRSRSRRLPDVESIDYSSVSGLSHDPISLSRSESLESSPIRNYPDSDFSSSYDGDDSNTEKLIPAKKQNSLKTRFKNLGKRVMESLRPAKTSKSEVVPSLQTPTPEITSFAPLKKESNTPKEYFDVNDIPVEKKKDIDTNQEKDFEQIMRRALGSITSVASNIQQEAPLFWTTYSDMILIDPDCSVCTANLFLGQGYLTHSGFVATEFTADSAISKSIVPEKFNLFSLQATDIIRHEDLHKAWDAYANCTDTLNNWKFQFNKENGVLLLVFSGGEGEKENEFYPILDAISILKAYVIPSRPLKERFLGLFGKYRPVEDISTMEQFSERYLTGKCGFCEQFETIRGAVKISQALLKGILYQKLKTEKQKTAFARKYKFPTTTKTKKEKEFRLWVNKHKFSPLTKDECGRPGSISNVVAVNYYQDKRSIRFFFKPDHSQTRSRCDVLLWVKEDALVPLSLKMSPRIKYSRPLQLKVTKKGWLHIK